MPRFTKDNIYYKIGQRYEKRNITDNKYIATTVTTCFLHSVGKCINIVAILVVEIKLSLTQSNHLDPT